MLGIAGFAGEKIEFGRVIFLFQNVFYISSFQKFLFNTKTVECVIYKISVQQPLLSDIQQSQWFICGNTNHCGGVGNFLLTISHNIRSARWYFIFGICFLYMFNLKS